MNPRSLVLWARHVVGAEPPAPDEHDGQAETPSGQPAPHPENRADGFRDTGSRSDALPLHVLWESGKPSGLRRVRPGAGATGWPVRTDTLCWHCCHGFDTQPIPIPIAYDDRKDTFTVSGVFCSFACGKAYNLDDRGGGYRRGINAVLITAFRKRCTGILGPIKMAPPRMLLKSFGGSMTIDDFRNASETYAFRSLPPRMVIQEHVFEQQARAAALAQSQKPAFAPTAAVDFKDAIATNETLKLKRPKPMQKDRNVLERTMGINVMLAKV